MMHTNPVTHTDDTTEAFDLPLALGGMREGTALTIRVKGGQPILRISDLGDHRGTQHMLTDSDMRDLHEWLERRLRSTGALIDGEKG